MLSIFLIGIALSMDSFSISLSLGTLNLSKSKIILIPIIVSIMHFIMPLLGLFLGNKIFDIININSKLVVSLILIYLAFLMLNNKEEKKTKITSIISIFLFAFSVSLDSFSVGIGLKGLTNHYILSPLVFSLCAGTITYIGLILGKYSIKFLKEKSVYLGASILFLIALINLCQVFTE